MSYKRFLAPGLAAVLALGAGACDDGLTDVNQNPNSPEDVPAPTLFVNATRLSASRWLGDAGLRQFEVLAQHMAEVQYPETDAYQRLTATFTENNFGQAYYQELKDYQQVVEKGMEAGAPGWYGPALVMRSWEFGVLTDLFGDVPYFSALAGDSLGAANAAQPAYDAQQEIYADLFRTLEQATTALSQAGGPSLGGADPLYGGNRASWQQFSNSLRARHALRVVNVDPALADAQLRAAFSAPGGVFTSNAHSARFPWPGNGVYDNPWAVNFQTRDDHRVSTRLTELLQATDDPRLAAYAQPTEDDPTVYRGLPNALSHGEAVVQVTTTSKPGQLTYAANLPAYLLTHAEVRFIQAEAAERGLGGLSPSQAAGFYEAGIRASMEQWGVTDQAAIDDYLAQPGVAYQGGEAGLRQIARQKWVALYTEGIQAWSEWRRTCEPFNVRPGPEATQNEVPRRLLYSTVERAVNAGNVQAAITRQGPDAFTTRIWWDRNPTAAPTWQAGCGQR
ncbi:SusD/RagB family nutrient-binding outer membrane lipoprotein [Longimicrobium sp.]|uniref:SusD/RagB family nutrient-binding outer membrane lipoprotein n=1 Tax=Longimicrobium sp. TaxID=2029185 RepID=UPI003B3BB78F